ncbi:serine/threonine-protein kinase [Paenibacillus sp. BR2-3]|uniref:serine/threonine protein kinase n=1 Tax=Paenibacillus sp. BR2-3 TaxID=3048494 RepID=UPI003977D7ED
MRMESKLSAGQILGGRYKISGIIGSGGMSHVHLAEDLRLPGKRWAVKECVTAGPQYGNVQAEAELLISLNHRRLPRVADFYPPDDDGYSYLVMDYIEGITLAHLMTANPGPVPGAAILEFAVQLLEVLQYLHGHHPPIVYRDLKPSNIMVNGQNELMLIDFGIARSFRNGGTEDTVKLGTVGFAAPEQYGDGQSQPVSDLYGLGALLLYMATGGKYSQWMTGMDRQLRGKVPAGLVPVIQRLLRHHPEDRYRDAMSVLKVISSIEGGSAAASVIPASTLTSTSKSTSTSTSKRTSTVALLGVAHGLGTTHTSLAVSGWLSRHDTTAWVDLCPGSPVYDRIQSMVVAAKESDPERESGEPFLWNGVHYWKLPEGRRLSDLPLGNYRYVVMDLGVGGYEGALEEFARSDVPLLMASGADWRLEETLLWLHRSGLPDQTKWKVCLPMAGRSSVSLLQGAVREGKVFGLPVQINPFKREGKLVEVLGELLKDIIDNRSYSKRGSFFKRR